ncbi:uncharacterized protein ACN2A1_013182 [Glossina fuscipes fuscipes]
MGTHKNISIRKDSSITLDITRLIQKSKLIFGVNIENSCVTKPGAVELLLHQVLGKNSPHKWRPSAGQTSAKTRVTEIVQKKQIKSKEGEQQQQQRRVNYQQRLRQQPTITDRVSHQPFSAFGYPAKHSPAVVKDSPVERQKQQQQQQLIGSIVIAAADSESDDIHQVNDHHHHHHHTCTRCGRWRRYLPRVLGSVAGCRAR